MKSEKSKLFNNETDSSSKSMLQTNTQSSFTDAIHNTNINDFNLKDINLNDEIKYNGATLKCSALSVLFLEKDSIRNHIHSEKKIHQGKTIKSQTQRKIQTDFEETVKQEIPEESFDAFIKKAYQFVYNNKNYTYLKFKDFKNFLDSQQEILKKNKFSEKKYLVSTENHSFALILGNNNSIIFYDPNITLDFIETKDSSIVFIDKQFWEGYEITEDSFIKISTLSTTEKQESSILSDPREYNESLLCHMIQNGESPEMLDAVIEKIAENNHQTSKDFLREILKRQFVSLFSIPMQSNHGHIVKYWI
jgi:hypothetical protein